ncbi:type VI secretion system membrane subunit TssM [Xanthobacter oligotrophicus]|uniref:type VI secretion system membrane subunit TssM n=1 Tax=Xanthobacter oligotrophicus TaxID=2607286 RepID=UPI0011F143ED|nr:type VI secretion system membrane subunit TssM [Xanthobacter oligotrophicus]MCG5233949.1 type VI secretion system membrane subunit TssM [Xanthobacter oligotrophicus]
MGRNLWLNLAAIGAGVAALVAVIWYAAPLLALGGYHPFENEGVRLAGIVIVCLTGMGYAAYYALERMKATRALGEAITEAQDEDDSAVLQDRMKDALATLRSAGGKGDVLYDLPWYVIIGPPGSGKTTALINSGLTFPLAAGRTPAAIAGVGGTRYCDWWFTEDAVLIDTAGRYTTQDSNAISDRRSWFAFLGLLKKSRARQPINGVIVAISIEDLVSLDDAEITAHAAAVRGRLLELHERLKIDFPVYVLLTKMDLIAGFTEFFADLGELQRRMVWGATFQNPKKNENLVGRVPEEFDALVERLTQFLPDRLQGENDPTGRLRIFGFPAQVSTLKPPVVNFLGRIFEPTRYHANAALRGFYFTSGTQQGTPIDRIIGSLSQSFGAQAVGEGYLSGGGKSYFLNDLVRKVIIGEAGWVSTDRAAVRRRFLLTTGGYVALAAITAAGVAAWTTSFTRNERLIATTVDEVDKYKAQAAPALARTLVDERQFERILPLLEDLARMPTGYASKDEPAPLAEGFGLSQRERLTSSAQVTYRAALERFLRPRLLFRLEEVLDGARANAAGIDRNSLYEAFKVYLMLGAQGPVDKGIILDWMRQDFATRLYPGPEKAGMRQALADHIAAMLTLDTGGGAAIALNGPLVQDIRQTLVRMNVAERAYQILRSRAHSGRIKEWNLSRVGTDMATVFTTTAGAPLDQVRIPGFYTYAGFQAGLIDALPDIANQLEKDRWVLGEAGQQPVVGAQFDTLADDILKLYARDFIKAWSDALSLLRIKPLTQDKPQYLVLSALSAAASPLKQILEEIRIQTQLSRLPKPAAEAVEKAAPAGRPAVVFSTDASAGRAIEDYFRPFYAAVEVTGGMRPVDRAVGLFGDTYNGLVGALSEPGRSNQMTASTRESIRGLRSLSGQFPPPFREMLRAATDDLEGNVAVVVVGDLQKSLAENVTQACQQVVAGRYPFTRTSDRDVLPLDFGRLFAPDGIMDRFYKEELATLIDTGKADWTWRQESKVGALLSNAALRDFQRAAQIRDIFFAQGGKQPGFSFALLALTPSAADTVVTLDVNGVHIPSPQLAAPAQPALFGAPPPQPQPARPAVPMLVQWPDPSGIGRVALVATSAANPASSFTLMERSGTWVLFRLMDQGKLVRQANATIWSLTSSGREFRYQVNVSSAANPFVMPALRDFTCPTSLLR